MVDNLTVKNAELTIDPNYKVTFYARGSIGMQGTGLIKHSCVDSANRPIAGCEGLRSYVRVLRLPVPSRKYPAPAGFSPSQRAARIRRK